MDEKKKHSFRYACNHGIVSLVVLLLLSPTVGAQPGPAGSNNQYPYAVKFSPSMAIIIVVLIAALFFMGFFSIYIRHCSDASGGSNNVRAVLTARSRRAAAARGLDPAVVDNFPTFAYSEVKGRKIGKGALECAVCLNEFEDNETLRLIPKCDHVFHPECIDAWLTSHVTCPVCRANLVPQPGESVHLPEPVIDIESQATDEVHSTANEQEMPEVLNRASSLNQNRPPRSGSVRAKLFGKFRSHSTGHSLVQPGENIDRFTLRLPVEVRKEVMDRALLNRTASCVVRLPREGSSRRGYRIGESSSRIRSFKRLEKLDRPMGSDRWVFSMAPPFFSKTASVRSPKVAVDTGEGSTSSRTSKGGMIKMPSFNCLEPKGDESGLVSADSAKPPVQSHPPV
ncbi:unnamed protein product [Ilex paraguariensis]|uniref:RING-type E3 ubiquitin transferase n=1 Tax=Ilex paraguariensis TaxID=185542 RepID=A0ABC8QNA3_9AQUA